MSELRPQNPLARRVVLDFDTGTNQGPVSGVALVSEESPPQRFSGWLDLMRLLEVSAGRTDITATTSRPCPPPKGIHG